MKRKYMKNKLFKLAIVLCALFMLLGCTKKEEETTTSRRKKRTRVETPTEKTTMIPLCLYRNGIADDSTTRIVFGRRSDYKVELEGGVSVDTAESGNISMYKDDDTVYILSNDLIFFNEESFVFDGEPYGIFDSTGSSYENSLKEIVFDNIDTSLCTDFTYMFFGCDSLEELDLSSFDTSNVRSMKGMFHDCYNLKSIDLSSFDTRNVEDMSSMFYDCYSLQELDLTSFDTTKVTESYDMFMYCDVDPLYNPSTWTIETEEPVYYYGK